VQSGLAGYAGISDSYVFQKVLKRAKGLICRGIPEVKTSGSMSESACRSEQSFFRTAKVNLGLETRKTGIEWEC
jgi:hypothetical protein